MVTIAKLLQKIFHLTILEWKEECSRVLIKVLYQIQIALCCMHFKNGNITDLVPCPISHTEGSYCFLRIWAHTICSASIDQVTPRTLRNLPGKHSLGATSINELPWLWGWGRGTWKSNLTLFCETLIFEMLYRYQKINFAQNTVQIQILSCEIAHK